MPASHDSTPRLTPEHLERLEKEATALGVTLSARAIENLEARLDLASALRAKGEIRWGPLEINRKRTVKASANLRDAMAALREQWLGAHWIKDIFGEDGIADFESSLAALEAGLSQSLEPSGPGRKPTIWKNVLGAAVADWFEIYLGRKPGKPSGEKPTHFLRVVVIALEALWEAGDLPEREARTVANNGWDDYASWDKDGKPLWTFGKRLQPVDGPAGGKP